MLQGTGQPSRHEGGIFVRFGQNSNAQRLGLCATDSLHLEKISVQPLDRVAGHLKQSRARRCEFDRAIGAFKQQHIEGQFDLRDLQTQARLSNEHTFGGTTEM